MTNRKVAPAKKPTGSDGEYMRQYRLRRNENVYSRIAIKSASYLTVEQAEKIEASINKMIGWK